MYHRTVIISHSYIRLPAQGENDPTIQTTTTLAYQLSASTAGENSKCHKPNLMRPSLALAFEAVMKQQTTIGGASKAVEKVLEPRLVLS